MLAGVLGAPCASCFNPTSYDAPSEASGTSDTGPGTTAESNSSTSATGTTSSSTSPSGTTSSTTTTAAASTGTTEPATTSCGQCCGDGEVQPPEECDDGNVENDDGCSSDCRKEFRYVFVTSDTFSGDLGGHQGADEKCQAAASSAGLSGMFRAWLSTSTEDPVDALVQSAVPYRRLDGMQVAQNWPDLIDGMLDTPINLTEKMTFVPGPVCDSRAAWTASFANGTEYDAGKTCSDWTSNSGTTTGGNPNETTGAWSHGCPLSCASLASLYCVEQ